MRSTSARLTAGVLCGTLLTSTGCYAYLAPTPSAEPPVRAAVRLTLTDSGSRSLGGRLGDRPDAVTGILVADSAETYVLRTTAVSYRSGEATDWHGELIALPKPLVAGLSIRQFSAGRTALLATGMLVGILAARRVFGGASDNTAPVIGFPRPGGQ